MTDMEPIQFKPWMQSIASLGFLINQLHYPDNLLGDKATERHHFFFSDSGVPLPRPCTALAWASLCAFGPVQGFKNLNGPDLPFSPSRGYFLLPFLPALRLGDEQDQSLPRGNKLHNKSEDDRILWGPIYIGNAETGALEETLNEGSCNAMEWNDLFWHTSKGGFRQRDLHRAGDGSQLYTPALYGNPGNDYQFGIIQNIPGWKMSLRDPMVELARVGIYTTKEINSKSLFVKRLLFRFSDSKHAMTWAKAYSEAMRLALDEEVVQDDRSQAQKEVEAFRKQSAEEIQKRGAKTGRAANISMLAGILSQETLDI